MGKHIHLLSDINTDSRTGICSNCGPVKIKTKGVNRWGCAKAKWAQRSPWLKHRKEVCERCGFVPEHECQLDVDHIDGNKNNNSLDNLKTLCANCHRLKTYQNKDWENKVIEVNPSEIP